MEGESLLNRFSNLELDREVLNRFSGSAGWRDLGIYRYMRAYAYESA